MKTQRIQLLALMLCGLTLAHAPRDLYTYGITAIWGVLVLAFAAQTLKRKGAKK